MTVRAALCQDRCNLWIKRGVIHHRNNNTLYPISYMHSNILNPGLARCAEQYNHPFSCKSRRQFQNSPIRQLTRIPGGQDLPVWRRASWDVIPMNCTYIVFFLQCSALDMDGKENRQCRSCMILCTFCKPQLDKAAEKHMQSHFFLHLDALHFCRDAGERGEHIFVYIYIHILGSSARFARAEAYGIISWDYIMGLYYGIISRDNITG